MRIVFIYKYSDEKGGIQELIKQQASFLKNCGCSLALLSDHPDCLKSTLSDEDSLKIIPLGIVNAIKISLDRKTDIINIFEPYPKYLLAALLMKIIHRKVRVGITFCGTRTEHPARFAMLFVKLGLFRRIVDFSFAISEYTKKVSMKNFPLRNHPIVTYLPVKTVVLNTPEVSAKKIVTIGRICRRKNYEGLIQIFAKVHDAYPDTTLDIIGGLEKGNRKYFDTIKAIIRERGLEEAVTFRIDITEDEKHKILARSLIYITASFHEMFGTSTVEAMSHGLPVVAYANSATEELVGKVGILVTDGEVDSFSQEISTLIDNRRLREALSDKSLRFSKYFEEGAVLSAYHSNYLRLIR